MNTARQEENRAKEQAKLQLESIIQMVNDVKQAEENNDEEARENAIETIENDPLEISVRSGWHVPGQEAENKEYFILLCTGGPACRIIGDLDKHNEPETARIEYQDWFTSWEKYPLTSEEEEIVLDYARCFYFGE